jgi:hypothetical protein
MKNSSTSFKRSFLIILAYGIGFGIGYITQLGNPRVSISFYVSEQKRFATYGLKLKDLLDLILVTPLFAIISFILLKKIIDDLSGREISSKKINTAYFIFLIALILFAYGNMIHITMNRLNADIAKDYGTEQVYYSVYFLDEFLGHHLVEIGFFIIFTEIAFLHTLNISDSEYLSKNLMNKKESSLNSVFGIALGVATSLLYLEGQSAFVFLILNPIICVILIYYNKRNKIRLKENSLLMLFLLMTISFTITTILWGVFTGIKPAYPFFFQNSEVDIFSTSL